MIVFATLGGALLIVATILPLIIGRCIGLAFRKPKRRR
jgi:hypothetical protein